MKNVIVINSLEKFLLEGRTSLAKSNVRIYTAASAEEILSIHRKEKGALLIVDLHMEGMAGDKLCAAIRAGKEEAQKAVGIIITCRENKSEIKRCQACGANAVITKPVKSEDLLSKVKDLLNISERGNLRGLVKVTVEGRSRDDFFFAISQNVSATGILLQTEKVFSQGDKLTCSFVMQRKITVSGEVVRVERKASDLYQYGVRFLDLDAPLITQIEEFVKSQQQA
ncbi:MAG: response regulator [Thermodesulfovibrionales bacterium]|jgi:CheY-like chemotaxis protein